jgi:hypothetical protein
VGERYYIVACTAARGICHECARDGVRHVIARSRRMVLQRSDAAALLDEGTIRLDQRQCSIRRKRDA